MLKFPVTDREKLILDDIADVGFGEIYDLTGETSKPTRIADVSEKAKAFLLWLRRQGDVNKVVIHDSEPTAAEFQSTTPGGLKCLRRIRF